MDHAWQRPNRAALSMDQDFAVNGVMRKTMSASELSMSTSSMNSSSSSSSLSPQRGVSRRSSLFEKMFRRGSISQKKLQEEVCVAELCVQELLYIMPRYCEPLQYNQLEVMKRERRQSLRRTFSPDSVLDDENETIMTLPQKKKQVTFHEDVVVVPIPLRDDYSHSLRAKLWSNVVERCDNEERNLIEFVSEDNDWRQVCLEEEMYTCSETQELIHPVHVETKLYTFCANKRGSLRRKPSLS